MSAPKVSVIIPVYNGEETIEKCVASVLGQSFRDIEVLAVDDGSRDSSLSLLTRLAQKDSRLCLLRKANGGVASARNLAINQARGQYLFFADSDDDLPPGALERLVAAMEQPQCDMVIAPYNEVVGSLSVQRGFLAQNQMLTQLQFLDHLSEYPNSFFYAVLWNKLYRRDLIIKNSIRCDDRLPWGEDFAFNTLYYRYVRNVATLEEPVYNYNRNLSGLALSTARGCVLHPFFSIKVKYWLQRYYNQLFVETGLYAAYRKVLPQYMFKITINR